MSNFEFNWKYEDFEIRTHSASTDKPYIELVKWDGKNGGKKSCYVLAFSIGTVKKAVNGILSATDLLKRSQIFR